MPTRDPQLAALRRRWPLDGWRRKMNPNGTVYYTSGAGCICSESGMKTGWWSSFGEEAYDSLTPVSAVSIARSATVRKARRLLAALVGVLPSEPYIRCDVCGTTRPVSTRTHWVARWLLDGKPAPGWSGGRQPDGTRHDVCGRCRKSAAGPPTAAKDCEP